MVVQSWFVRSGAYDSIRTFHIIRCSLPWGFSLGFSDRT